MKNACVLIALCACSSVATADYIVDTLTSGAHSFALSGNNAQQQYTSPTNSDIPTSIGLRDTYLQTGEANGGAAASTMSVGGGQMNFTWTLSAPAGSGSLALAGTALRYYYGAAPLGHRPTLSIPGSGSFTGDYTTAEVNVQILDTSSRLASWWVPFTPGAFTGTQLDLSSAPGLLTPGFDFDAVSYISLQFAFIMQPGATAMSGSGDITITQIDFIPTPAAATLGALGLGTFGARRRRR